MVTQPGVVSGSNTGGGSHVHGARDRAWNYTLDGIDVNEASQGGSEDHVFPRESGHAERDAHPDRQQSQPRTDATAARRWRWSRARAATNFHGTGFWFYRTPALAANEWESNLAGVGKVQLQQNIYGGGIGGPVIKNKTFFFSRFRRCARARAR